MDDWVDDKETLASVPVLSDQEEQMEMDNPSNRDEQAGSTDANITGTGSNEKEKLAEDNGETGTSTGTGIIESIASMIPGHSTDEGGGGEHKEEDGAGVSNGGETENVADRNKERQDQNGEQQAGAGTGIIDSIASKFGVTVSGHSTKEEEEQEEGDHKNKDNGGTGTTDKPISSPPEGSLPLPDDDVPATDEAIMLISIIED